MTCEATTWTGWTRKKAQSRGIKSPQRHPRRTGGFSAWYMRAVKLTSAKKVLRMIDLITSGTTSLTSREMMCLSVS